MEYTPNLNLNKPEQTDFYDVDEFNENADIIDEEISKRALRAAAPTAGNILTVDANGNPVDSGTKPSDFGLASDLNSHEQTDLQGTFGVHGMRYHEDTLQFWDGTDWIDISTIGGLAPADAYNVSIVVGNGQLTIKWNDPEDTIIQDILLSEWSMTKLVRKVGSFPANESDGTLVVTNSIRNQYSVDGFIDTGLTNDVTYYYTLFPVGTTGAVNLNPVNNVSGIPKRYYIFGVSIDLTNSNPLTSVTYTDDAVGMIGGSSDWDTLPIFKDIKPCVLNNGVVQYYLNPNNFTQKDDGTPADLTGTDGDVMIEFPKTGLIINTVDNVLTIQITDNPNESSFHYYAHTRETEGDRNKLYIGAYLGCFRSPNNRLRSISDVAPSVNQTIDTFRIRAQANGSGYDLLSFYPLTLIQALFVIRFKSLDSQTAFGMGYVGGSATQNTGATKALRMYYGTSSTTSRVKCFGIEDLWGNLSNFIDGLYLDFLYNIWTGFRDFNDTGGGSGYMNRGQGAISNISGYMSKPQGTSETGFIIKEGNGSSTTYFADSASLNFNSIPLFGGRYNANTIAGVFNLQVAHSSISSVSYICGRLMYL